MAHVTAHRVEPLGFFTQNAIVLVVNNFCFLGEKECRNSLRFFFLFYLAWVATARQNSEEIAIPLRAEELNIISLMRVMNMAHPNTWKYMIGGKKTVITMDLKYRL